MISKSLLKNPILMIGILFMAIYMMTHGKDLFKDYKRKLTPTSCRALLVKLNSKKKQYIPKHWKTYCEKNNLAIEYKLEMPKTFRKEIKDPLKKYIYRDLANSLTVIAKAAPTDNLEKTDIVRLTIKTDVLTLNAVTDGMNLSKLYHLTDPNLIAKHLKVTVQVQEVLQK